MAPATEVASSDTITLKDFNAALARYPSLIDDIDASKPGTAKKTLKELDAFRYEEAPALFSGDGPQREMDIDDVKALVEWKLRHGKFRPTLMKLVSGNEPSFVKETVRSAIQKYRKQKDNPQASLDILVKLKGIGPATASLLLNVHDPSRVIFFSDEAFYWLCGGGQKVSLKYNAKEYVALREAASGLQERLDVSATEVEKVAYVLFKATDTVAGAPQASQRNKSLKKVSSASENGNSKKLSNPKHEESGSADASKPSAKRKSEVIAQGNDGGSGVRRSKRTRG